MTRLGLLVIAACASPARPPANASAAGECPPGTAATVEGTVEGPSTWWACRDGTGRPHGPSRMTFAGGTPRNAGSYAAGEADGLWVHWDRDGRVEATGHWRAGTREGRWAWSDSNGSRVEHYAAGLPVGQFVRRFPNGGISEEGSYRAGQKVGVWKTWNAAGVLVREEPHVADLREGVQRAFHDSGALGSTLPHVAGEPHGHAVTFHPDGAKASEGNYVAGKATGRWTHWSPDGRVEESGEMVDGQRHGDWQLDQRTIYFERGREGRLRPCPPGSKERDECVARCCDRTGRWCELPDGTRVGPSDVWDVFGRLVSSTP